MAPMLNIPFYVIEGIKESPMRCIVSSTRCLRSTVAPCRYPRCPNPRTPYSAAEARTATCSISCAVPTANASSALCSRRSRGAAGLLALLAFDHELARTRSVTQEPMLARIRLEWWREAMAEAAGSRRSPERSPLSNRSERNRAPAYGLQRSKALVRLIDAREEEIEGPLDVMRAGHALADLELERAGRRRRREASRRQAAQGARDRLAEPG